MWVRTGIWSAPEKPALSSSWDPLRLKLGGQRGLASQLNARSTDFITQQNRNAEQPSESGSTVL
jgi:hypothetical protein